MTKEELQRHLKDEQAREEASKIVRDLGDLLNYTNSNKVAEGIADGLLRTHRTLQQTIFRALLAALPTYIEGGSDARNDASIELAKKIVEIDTFLAII